MSDDNDFLSSTSPSTVGMVICFGTITFTATAMAARSFLLGDSRAILAAITFRLHRKDSILSVENSFVSIFVLLYHLALLGLVLLLTYIVQHHPPFPHEDRAAFDPDYLVFLVLLMLFFAFTTIRRNDGRSTDRQTNIARRQAVSTSVSSTYEDSSTTYTDDGSTIASELPSIATRRSYRTSTSGRSGRSSRSGASTAGSQNSAGSRGSMEEIDFQESSKPKGSTFLDTLEEESLIPRNNVNGSQSSSIGSVEMEEVRLFDDDGSLPTAKSADNRSRMSAKPVTVLATLDVLNVHQSLEWKGLLSACFLLYQLTDAESSPNETNLYYNAAQVGGSCFVFLTGFGHAMYFYTRNNFRLGRVLRVLFRINLVAAFLCATMGRSYIIFYVCPLHSLAFLMTFGVMKAKQGENYSKYGLRMKLLALVIAIFVIWDFNLGLFDLFFSPFFSRGPPSESIPNGPLWEWYYHSHMHHWASFVGILYAVNYPITSLLVEKLELLSEQQIVLAKGTVSVSLLLALTMWTSGPFTTPRFAFDSTHSYFAFLPILSFVYFRNATAYLRQHHLMALKRIGEYSLEIFLFHHYFFLADDGTSVLVLMPGYPKVNVIISVILLLIVARTVHNLTTILCGMIFPMDDDNMCIRSLATFTICGLAFYCLAFALDSLSLTGEITVMIGILVLGLISYHTIMDRTWTEYKNIGRQLSSDVPDEETPTARASPPIIGTMVILVLGTTWNILSFAGATGGNIPLPQTCEAYVNEGMWAPVSPCTEFQRGIDTRDLFVDGYYRNCEDGATMHWGWRQTRPNLNCRFHSRGAAEMQKRLSHRKIVFIGDLTVRSLYHALCRLLGDTSAGKYDARVADHADISKGIGNIRLEYKWAPLAFDQVSKMKNIRTKGNHGQKLPDLLVVGGGALDRLHVWATDEDQESHKVAVQKLSKELEFASAPTVWCTPTTVNTPALGNDEKRNQMNEMAISEIRKMYAELDVEESAGFVLDGPSYSRGRVAESHDGVLYPRNVYDAGIQIVANSFDWLLPTADSEDSLINPPSPGSLSNPFLGLMMACFGLIGLFFFDGYLGFSYLSSLFVRRNDGRKRQQHQYPQASLISIVMPNDLYDEAFVPYHQRLKLPSHTSRAASGIFASQGRQKKSDENPPQRAMQDSDILSLLDSDSLLGGNASISRRSVGR